MGLLVLKAVYETFCALRPSYDESPRYGVILPLWRCLQDPSVPSMELIRSARVGGRALDQAFVFVVNLNLFDRSVPAPTII